MNKSFPKVFEIFSELKESTMLSSAARQSDGRGGDGPRRWNQSIPWKPTSEFKLQDEEEYDDESVQIFPTITPLIDEDDKYITNAIIGIQAPRKFSDKILSEEEQRIWYVVSWPSSLADVLWRSHEV